MGIFTIRAEGRDVKMRAAAPPSARCARAPAPTTVNKKRYGCQAAAAASTAAAAAAAAVGPGGGAIRTDFYFSTIS